MKDEHNIEGRLYQHLDGWTSNSLWCPDADMKPCLLINDQVPWVAPWMPDNWRPSWCVHANCNTLLWRTHTSNKSCCCVWSLYRGGLNQGCGANKGMGKQKPILKLIEGPHVPLPQTWSTFIALDENKPILLGSYPMSFHFPSNTSIDTTSKNDIRWLRSIDRGLFPNLQ